MVDGTVDADTSLQGVRAASFGVWLKERRKSYDLTQEELADRVGCSRDTIRKLELSQRRPSRQVAGLLAAELGVPPAEWTSFVQWVRTEGTAQPRILDSRALSAIETENQGQGTLYRFPSLDVSLDTGAPIAKPYKGLHSFSVSDAPDFFGREALVDQLLARLNEQTEFSHFLAVVGPSGSGKSSLVRAGLISRLQAIGLPGGLRPIFADARPGAHPAREVKAALLRSISTAEQAADGNAPARGSLDNEQGLLATAQQILVERKDSGLLLLIDQFEEVFTLVSDEAARAGFLKAIYSALCDGILRNRLWIVVTLRADFYDRPLAYPDIGQLIGKRTAVVTPMTRAELRRAILGPAERVSLELEPNLAAVIEQDVGEQPGTLPLMEYALSELFEQRTGRLLTLQAYKASGGVGAALGRRAEAIYSGLTSDERREAKQLFFRLVSIEEGVENTRRRVLRSELVSAASDEEALDQVLDIFGEYRLLTFDRDQRSGRPTVEVAHEALLTAWALLREWLDDNMGDLHMHRRLMLAASDWEQTGRDPSILASGARLSQFEALAAQSDLSLTPAEQAYLRASLAAQERARAQQERRRRRTIGVLTAGLVLTIILATAALAQSFQANEQRDRAVASANARATAEALAEAQSKEAQAQQRLAFSRELEMESQAKLASNPNLGFLLAIEAARLSRSREAEVTLKQALIETQPHTVLRYSAGDGVTSACFSPDGKLVATTSSLATRVWEVSNRTGNSGNIVAEFPNVGSYLSGLVGVPAGATAALSPDNKQVVVVVTQDLVATAWDVGKQTISTRLVGHTNTINSAQFSLDGKFIATASNDKTIRIWDAATGKSLIQLTNNTGIVNTASFSPDGRRIVTASDDNSARVWDLASGAVLATLSGHSDWVNAAVFSPDGKMVVTASNDKTARIWDASTGKSLFELKGHAGSVNSAQFSPDGKLVVTGSNDNTARVWDVSSGLVLAEINGTEIAPTSGVEQAAAAHIKAGGFSPDSKRVLLITGGSDVAARIYPWQLFTPIGQLLPLAASLAPRGLTCEERRTYLHDTTSCLTLVP